MNNDDWRSWKAAPPGKRKDFLMNKMVKENEPLARKFLTRLLKFSTVTCEQDDLMQAALMGLFTAIGKYSPDRPTKFSTMAWWWVKYYVQVEQIRQMPIKRPRGFGMPYKKYVAAEAIMTLYGRPATAADLGVTEEEFGKWQHTEFHFTPLEELDSAAAELERTDDNLIAAELDVRLHAALSKLTDIERKIALGEDTFGLSQQKVQEIRNRVIEDLREELDD